MAAIQTEITVHHTADKQLLDAIEIHHTRMEKLAKRETFVADITKFTEAVGCTTTYYNTRQIGLYTGLQLEEMAEKLEAIGLHYSLLIDMLHKASREFKTGLFDDTYIAHADRTAMLDADIDLAWVTIGAALSSGADVLGAMHEVARSNLAKLVICEPCAGVGTIDGEIDTPYCPYCHGNGLVAIKDENGKVQKPAGWTAPDLDKFVG